MPFNNSSINLSNQMDFIQKHGEWLNYYIGMKCTCTSSMMMTGSNLPDPNRANPNCNACHGTGWVYQNSGQIIGIIENINQHKELLMSGLAAPGDLILIPDLRLTLSDYDKIQLTWPEGIPFEGELVTRGTGTSDTTLYGIMSVQQCITVDPLSGAITKYTPDVDFTFNRQQPTNSITWISANAPAAGAVYSLKYQALVDWIVFTPPQPRRERGTNLGQRIILRKKHIVFSSGGTYV